MAIETVPAAAASTPVALLQDLDRWMAAANHGADHPWRAAIASTLATDPVAWRGMTAMSPADPAKTRQRGDFFCLDCRYSIEPGATLPGLVHDGHALMASAVGVLEKIGVDEDAMFAPLHLLRQAVAVIGAAAELSEAVERQPRPEPSDAKAAEPIASPKHVAAPAPMAALRTALDFVAVAQTMSVAMTSLLADLNTFADPATQGHSYGLEACIENLAHQAESTAEVVESALRIGEGAHS